MDTKTTVYVTKDARIICATCAEVLIVESPAYVIDMPVADLAEMGCERCHRDLVVVH